jgi:TrmH family RNA methyltransferase
LRLEKLTVTLVGPEFPINVGYAARLVKNFGVRKLYLIEPKFDRRVASVYAAHGADVLEDAEEIDFDALRERHDLLVGTTAVTAIRRANVNRLSVPPEEMAGYVSCSKSASLVFGRDTTGLRNDELARCDLVTSIGTGTSYKTLNVSHSMGILLYVLSKSGVERRALPSLGERDLFAAYAYELAVVAGLPQYRAERLRKLAGRIALRSQLDGKEIDILVYLLRKAANTISKQTD